MIRVEIPGEPHSQTRPRMRVVHAGGKSFAHTYEAKGSRDWKATAQEHMRRVMEAAKQQPITGAARVRILAIFACPTSKHRKTAPRPREWYRGQKDWDNIGKAVCDAANGVLWIDDRQVAIGEVRAIVGAQGEAPRVILRVDPIAELDRPRLWQELEDTTSELVPNRSVREVAEALGIAEHDKDRIEAARRGERTLVSD